MYLEDATPSYGKDTLEGFFTKAIKEGLKGQELGGCGGRGGGEGGGGLGSHWRRPGVLWALA